jgi:HEAT repeat protein/S1-C subfamily serine protease
MVLALAGVAACIAVAAVVTLRMWGRESEPESTAPPEQVAQAPTPPTAQEPGKKPLAEETTPPAEEKKPPVAPAEQKQAPPTPPKEAAPEPMPPPEPLEPKTPPQELDKKPPAAKKSVPEPKPPEPMPEVEKKTAAEPKATPERVPPAEMKPEPAPQQAVTTALAGEQVYDHVLRSTVWILAKQQKGISFTFRKSNPGPPGFGGRPPGPINPSAVAGSHWAGTETQPDSASSPLKFLFLSETKVIMDDGKESVPGGWTQKGTDVTIKLFGGEVTYTGRVEGNQMTGTARNATGTWDWTVTRQIGNEFKVNFVPTSTGTGSLVDRKHRLIVTNVHVVGDAEQVTIHFPEHKQGELVVRRDAYKKTAGIVGKVVLREERCDLALVQLERLPEKVRVLPLSRNSARPAQQVHSVGNPGVSAALWCYSPGKVRQIFRDKWETAGDFAEKPKTYEGMVLQTDSPINPGDSGGPLVNDRGALVGVAHAINTAAQNFSTFIDVSEVRALVARFYEGRGEKWVPEPEPAGAVDVVRLSEWMKKLDHMDALRRAEAAEALGKLGEDARLAFGPLFERLKDKDALVRRAAGDALDKVPPHKDDLPLLCKACAASGEPPLVRLKAVAALQKLGTEARGALPQLTGLLKDADEGLARAALSAMLDIGVRAGEVPALSGLLKHPDAEVRGLALQGLARIGPDAKSAVNPLVAALKAEDAITRREAAKTLGAVGAGTKECVKALTETLHDPDFEVGLESARALSRVGDPKVGIPFLKDALKKRNSQEERLACIRVLKEIGSQAVSAVPNLASALEETVLREAAADALAKMGRPAVLVLQKKMVASNDAKARLASVNTVGKIAAAERLTSQTLRDLLQALQAVVRLDPVTENREAALRVSQQIRGER